jgi:hypothetical protein
MTTRSRKSDALRRSAKQSTKKKTTPRSASTSKKGKGNASRRPLMPKKINALKKAKIKTAMPSAEFYSYDIANHGELTWHIERFEKLLKKFNEADVGRLKKAYRYAGDRHRNQLRSDGTSFIIHPVRLANILMSEWSEREADVVIAGLLHDVIEDTQTTTREIKDAFGDVVAKLVDGMTMWKGSESPEVYLQRISRGPEKLKLIKCADVLDNLRSWHACPKDVALKFPRWWRQTKDYVVPISESIHSPAEKIIKAMIEDDWYLKQAQMD